LLRSLPAANQRLEHIDLLPQSAKTAAGSLNSGASTLNIILSAQQLASAPKPTSILDFSAGAGARHTLASRGLSSARYCRLRSPAARYAILPRPIQRQGLGRGRRHRDARRRWKLRLDLGRFGANAPFGREIRTIDRQIAKLDRERWSRDAEHYRAYREGVPVTVDRFSPPRGFPSLAAREQS
jgi:hypothetical protein